MRITIKVILSTVYYCSLAKKDSNHLANLKNYLIKCLRKLQSKISKRTSLNDNGTNIVKHWNAHCNSQLNSKWSTKSDLSNINIWPNVVILTDVLKSNCSMVILE